MVLLRKDFMYGGRNMKKQFKVLSIICLAMVILTMLVTVGSAQEEVEPLGKPQNVYPASEAYGVTITWNSVEGAVGYNVYRRTETGVNQKIATVEGEQTVEYYDASAKNATRYYYSVAAFGENGEGKRSDEKRRTFVASAVVKKPVNKDGSITVEWEKVKGADKYLIYKKTYGGKWSKIATVGADKSSLSDKSVKNNTLYYYSVVTLNGKTYSTRDDDGAEIEYMSVPKNFTLKNSYNAIRFYWNEISGAKEYIVYRKDTKNNKWVRLGVTENTLFIDDTIKNGTIYYYTVRAVGHNSGVSAFKASSKYMALFELKGVSVTCKPVSVRISWQKASVGTGYKVFKLVDGKWKYIKGIKTKDTTYYDDTDVKQGKTYTYMVRSYYGDAVGSFNTKGYTTKFYPAPYISAKYSPDGIVVSWSKSYGATGYTLQHKAEGGTKWSNVKTVYSLSDRKAVHGKPTYGKKNYYRVVALGTGDATVISYVKTMNGINPKKKMVALTYDDGPHKTNTPKIVNTLAKYNGRATFFVVGSRVGSYKAAIKGAVKIGCEIGNHTYDHKTLTAVSVATMDSQINKTNSIVKTVCGVTPKIVRTPGGAVNKTVINNVDYPIVGWSVDTLDWKYRKASSVEKKIKSNVKDGSIILMHDLYGSTATATENIVPWLVNNGYQLVTVSEMMQVKGVDFKAGKVYSRAS